MTKRRIIGIDPGSRVTGFGVIDLIGQSRYYVASGSVNTPKSSDLAERIRLIVLGLTDVIQLYQPTESAIEKIFVNVNPAATLMLGQARGACISALVMQNLSVAEYTALQIKQAVVGQGKAPKEQVQYMVKLLLKLSGNPQADAADALACALTHANHTSGSLGRLGLNKVLRR